MPQPRPALESHSAELPGAIGFAIHGFNGQNVVPVLGLLLLLVSFFAKVPRGIMWAGLVLVLVLAQVFLSIFGAGVPELGVLHGLNALVLFSVAVIAARQARLPAATGSPWWVDSLNVGDGESYDIAFLAGNPGVWMGHCHNLTHAAEGLVAHLMYQGVTEPYTVGGASANEPE